MNMTPTTSQQEAIESKAKTLVVLATAGSGKTSTLVARYMAVGGKTVIITFTNSGAKNLRTRIAEAGGEPPLFCGTLHAFCLQLLRDAGRRVAVLDEATADDLLTTCAADVGCKTPPKRLRLRIADGKATGKDKLAIDRYVRALRMADSTDYDLLLVDALEYLNNHDGPEFYHLMVDEAQDGAFIDSLIYRALWCEIRTIVGDLDQQIYSFRGADPEALRSFMVDAHIVRMEECFRCDRLICQAAQHLITKAPGRVKKDTISKTGGEGHVGLLKGAPFSTAAEETAAVVKAVRWIVGAEKGTVAVLCRYNRTRQEMTAALVAAGLIPVPTAKFPRDWKHAVLSLQAWGAPGNAIAAKAYLTSVHGPEKAARYVRDAAALRTDPVTGLERLDLRAMMEKANLSRDARARVLDAADGSEDAGRILMALREEDTDSGPPCAVSVMTCHGAKGLEFDTVIIPACEDELYKPHESEERRLMFVAFTRARHRLLASYAKTRPTPWGNGAPTAGTRSQFLADALL